MRRMYSEEQLKKKIEEYAPGGGELTPEALAEVLEGSETVVVDVNEEGDKLQVRLDADVVSKIDKALVVPVEAPAETVLVGISTGREQQNINLSSLLPKNNFSATGNCEINGSSNTVTGYGHLIIGGSNTISNSPSRGIIVGTNNRLKKSNTMTVGYLNEVNGSYASAFGQSNRITGDSAFTAGDYNTADGTASIALGGGCRAYNTCEVSVGQYNVSSSSIYPNVATAFTVGGGTSDSNRSNLFAIYKDGHAVFSNTITIGGTTLSESQLQALLALIQND